MDLRLMVNGDYRNVRIVPVDGFDKKLISILAEAQRARLIVDRGLYERDIKHIDLVLEFEEKK